MRRTALQTGTLFLGAGLLGTAPAMAAEPLVIPSVLPTVVHTDDIGADCRRLLAVLQGEDAAFWAADAALEATLSPEQQDLYHKALDAASDRDCTYHEWQFIEIARHLPAFSTVFRLLWFHIVAEGTDVRSSCCTVAEGFEP